MLDKRKIQTVYEEKIRKALEAGALVELSKEEMETWEGGVHYVTHFPVENPASLSMPVRVVSNSKMKNAKTGLSFNDMVRAVPNALNDIWDVSMQ